MFRLPSPAMFVAMASMLVALGGAGYSATGGNWILGRANTASTPTALTAHVNGKALQVTNQLGAANATGLGITVAAGRPPMTVNSTVKVANLNADKLDGLDSLNLANRRVVQFNLAGGAVTAPIAIPANVPVFVVGTTVGTNIGVGHASLLGSASFMVFNGVNSCCNVLPDELVHVGVSATQGGHIIYIDETSAVALQVNSSTSIRVHNGTGQQKAGRVMLIW